MERSSLFTLLLSNASHTVTVIKVEMITTRQHIGPMAVNHTQSKLFVLFIAALLPLAGSTLLREWSSQRFTMP